MAKKEEKAETYLSNIEILPGEPHMSNLVEGKAARTDILRRSVSGAAKSVHNGRPQ